MVLHANTHHCIELFTFLHHLCTSIWELISKYAVNENGMEESNDSNQKLNCGSSEVYVLGSLIHTRTFIRWTRNYVFRLSAFRWIIPMWNSRQSIIRICNVHIHEIIDYSMCDCCCKPPSTIFSNLFTSYTNVEFFTRNFFTICKGIYLFDYGDSKKEKCQHY